MDQFNQHIPTQQEGVQQLDWSKLKLILRKSMPWILLIFIIHFTASFLFLRYTKPMYQSNSEIKLDQKNQSNILGLPQLEQTSNFGLLSSEIELIKSRLFFNKVIETVDLNPQYFTYGKILDDEKYLTPPFTIEYKILDANIFNVPIDISFIDEKSFELSYSIGKETLSYTKHFDDSIHTAHLDCIIRLIQPYNFDDDSKFYFKINSREALINYIASNLSVEPLNLQANTFRISFKDNNLNKAHTLVSAIDTIYLNYSLQEKTKANRNKIEYLNRQLLETEKKLDDFENYFEEVTINDQTVNLEADVKRTVDAINGLDSQRVKINNRIEEIKYLQESLNETPYKNLIPKVGIYPQHLNEIIEEFNLLNNDLERLSLSYKANTYTYKSRQKEVELLRKDLLSGISNFNTDLSEKLKKLSTEKQTLRSQLLSLPSKSTEFNKSKRFYALYEDVYLSLMQSKNEFEIAIAGSVTEIKVLSPASLSGAPIYPVPLMVYATAGILSMFFSFLFIGTSYLAHNKIQNIREIESLTSATILGSVPKHTLNGKVAKIVVSKHPKSAVSEALRSIRTNIEFLVPDKKCKIISITSTIGSEGKTFISTNLGALLAMGGKKTIVVDLDLRKPKIHLAFGITENTNGVSSILINKNTIENCTQISEIPNLEFISAGSIPPNPSELILRKEFNELIEELKSKYEIIILDTPPVGLVTDGLLAMQKADLPIYVLKAGFSKYSFVHNINRVLANDKFKNLSVILNATTTDSSGYGYGKKSAYYEI